MARHVGEPHGSAGGIRRVAEERPGAEDHVPGPGFADGRPGCVAAEIQQTDVARRRRIGIDDRARDGMHAVASNEQIAGRVRAVVESGADAGRRHLGADQALAELDAHAPRRLLVQCAVQMRRA